MIQDKLLSQHIKTIDHLFYSDLWGLLEKHGQTLEEIAIKKGENNNQSASVPDDC
jgi:hypothetical protein